MLQCFKYINRLITTILNSDRPEQENQGNLYHYPSIAWGGLWAGVNRSGLGENISQALGLGFAISSLTVPLFQDNKYSPEHTTECNN